MTTTRVLLSTLLIACVIPVAASAGDIRYIVGVPSGQQKYPLWTSRLAATQCGRAVVGGTPVDVQMFCRDGVAGIKPTVGDVSHGTEVEIVDGSECRDMVQVRVLSGPHAGYVGCIVGKALSSRRPADVPAPPTPTATDLRPPPDWCRAENLQWLGDRCVEKK
jgi:hypothetical protein